MAILHVNCYVAISRLIKGVKMPDADKNFDAQAFYAALADTVEARSVTWKQVSKDTGVSATTLTRMAQGRNPDAASQAALAAWAGLNPADFVVRSGKKAAQEPLAAALTLLRADPKLKPDAATALEAIVRAAYKQLRKEGK
jgi:transcriptional regulator with XRE-family HTH domain